MHPKHTANLENQILKSSGTENPPILIKVYMFVNKFSRPKICKIKDKVQAILYEGPFFSGHA